MCFQPTARVLRAHTVQSNHANMSAVTSTPVQRRTSPVLCARLTHGCSAAYLDTRPPTVTDDAQLIMELELGGWVVDLIVGALLEYWSLPE